MNSGIKNNYCMRKYTFSHDVFFTAPKDRASCSKLLEWKFLSSAAILTVCWFKKE